MPGLTLARSVAILREHRERTSARHVDLAISLRVCDVDTSGPDPRWLTDTDEELVEVGGRWDRRRKRWIGAARELHILRVPRGSDQEQPARWLAEWFRRHARGPRGAHWDAKTTIPGRDAAARWGRAVPGRISVEFRRVWTLMLVGGRRGGKSHLAVVALVLMMVLCPRSIVWAISPTQEETDELEQAARSMLPRAWYTEPPLPGKALQFKLANGSRLLFLSGHKPRSLKRGRCDLAVLNESQNMYRATWRQLRGAIADRAGLVILPCNPPDEAIGKWIEEVYALIRAGRIAAEAFHLVAKGNPFVTEEALEEMRREVDDVTAAREVDGKMGIPLGDTVFHAWSAAESIREVPAGWKDVTAEVARQHLGRAAGYIVGMDFQLQPHEAAAVLKFFEDPAEPGVPIPWVVDGVLVEDANEDQLLDALERLERWTPAGRVAGQCYRGWIEPTDDKAAPVHCAVVMDASAWWQDSEHNPGKQSDRILTARRWTFCYRPQKDSDRNPNVAERCKVTNARLKEADKEDGTPGRRRMFSCPHNLEINTAMAQWENHKITGQPNRRSKFAHACDAVSYPVYRVFGKPKPRSSGEYRGAGRHDRAAELRDW